MLPICFSIAAALAINAPIDIPSRSALFGPYLEKRECMMIPAEDFRPGVVGLHIVDSINELYIISGTNHGTVFWSWTPKDGPTGKELAEDRKGV